MNTEVYLLAAGRGRRAGGPKAWQEFQGRSLLQHQIDFLLRRHTPGEVAVSMQADWEGRCRALHGGIRWITVDPDASALGALIALLAEAPPHGWSFVYHVDMPVWEPALFDALIARIPEAVERHASGIVPTHEGRGGHPVLLAPSALLGLSALDPRRDRLDHWLREHGSLRVEVPFACIHENWNLGVPEDPSR